MFFCFGAIYEDAVVPQVFFFKLFFLYRTVLYLTVLYGTVLNSSTFVPSAQSCAVRLVEVVAHILYTEAFHRQCALDPPQCYKSDAIERSSYLAIVFIEV